MNEPLVTGKARVRQQALVLGGGMAGMLAARVLLDHFGHVTLVGHPADADARLSGHVLAVRGFRVLERLFPGLGAELALGGAPSVDWTADCPTLLPAGWAPRFHSGLTTRAASGAALAATVRRRLMEYGSDRLELQDDYRAVGLLWEGERVTGAHLTRADDTTSTRRADFVIDATGRASRAGEWLALAGFAASQTISAGAPATYATAVFRRPVSADPAWRALLAAPGPHRCGALLHPLEGYCWVVTLALPAGTPPPSDVDSFLRHLRDLPTPALHDALHTAELLEPPASRTHPGIHVNAFHRLSRWPDGFGVTGEAVCALDTAYGHSLTATALGALALESALAEQRRASPDGTLEGLGRRFQRALAGALSTPLRVAAAFDSWRAGAAGLVASRCGDGLLAAAVSDPDACRALVEAFTLAGPPAALLRPTAVLRALRPAAAPVVAPGPLPPAPDPGAGRSTQELAALS